MLFKNQSSKNYLYASLLTFFAFAVCIMYLNREVLYTAHNRSEFLYGTPYFNTMMSSPFGLMQYVGAWLTQFYFNPWLGASIQMLFWVLIFFVGKKAFQLKGNASTLMLVPVACLLTSLVDLGYWIYILPIRGYWFSQTIGYLAMLLLLWTARCTPRQWHLAWYVAAVCLFPVLGWFSILFVLCLAITERPGWRELAGVILLLFTANIWRELLYSNRNLAFVMQAGFPRFETPVEESALLALPFWIIAAFSLLAPCCSRFLDKWFVPVASAVAGICLTWGFMFQDKNYIDEMRMIRYAEVDNWDEVLNVASENPTPTTSMIMLNNIALMNQGGLLDHSMKYVNNVQPINTPDSMQVTMLEITAPLVYYNYGLLNEGIRLAYEDAIQEGMSPFYMKILARSTRATGEMELSNRFVSMLRHLPGYAHWKPAPLTKNVFELSRSYPDKLPGMEGSENFLVNSISTWFNSDIKVASEQALFYAMIRCDSKRFWPSLRNYVELHMNEEFPIHAQEAYILYMDKSPEKKRMIIPVSQDVLARYNQFWKEVQESAHSDISMMDLKEKMHERWSDTYWYYNVFVSIKY